MSGDVQPRKRKDKKKKKDELGIEEPRGTAAAFGEGDVFIHSYHEHGTGGHWCAKIIFFSLLAVLVTLIGLIILENRGLSDLEANAVESRYSGVLEGWIEDAPDNDHHDEHTLELKHPDDEEVHEGDDEDDTEDFEHNENDDDEDERNENGEKEDDNDEVDDEDEGSEEQKSEIVEDEIQEEDNADLAYSAYKRYDDQNDESEEDEYKPEESDEGDDGDDGDDNDEYEINENDDQVKKNYNGAIDHDDEKWEKEEEHEEDGDDEEDEEVERIEREISDEDIISSELDVEEGQADDDNDASEEEDAETTQLDDEEEPPVERITIPPPGQPYTEIEEETIQKTPDTLADEEEYERQQEQLKKEREAQSSQGVWLKLLVGGALLAATHAVVRRATAPRDEPEEENLVEEPSISDRRMTLIPQTHTTPEIIQQVTTQEEIVKKSPIVQSVPLAKLKPEEDKNVNVVQEEIEEKYLKENDKELYSDEEEEDEEIDEEEEEEEVEEIVVKKPEVKETKVEPINKPVTSLEEPHEEDEDVEIIDEEEIEEELEDEEEEEEVEEEISDVDDSDLLNRLDAKYGRLPEPERPGKNKGGGNSIEDDWPGEPNDPYWSQQLDLAEEELRQGWLE